MALDLKSPGAQQVLERLVKWADVLIVNTPHPARKNLKLEYDDVAPWNPRLIYADVTGYGDNGPDADLPGFDITAYWARSGLLSLTRDAGAPPTWPVSGSGDHATAVSLYSAIVTALYRRERTGKGSYVTTSLLAAGVWARACRFRRRLPRRSSTACTIASTRQCGHECLSVSRRHLVCDPRDARQVAALAHGIGRTDLLKDARFADPAKQAANMPLLTAILDQIFASQPMAHWYEAFNGVPSPLAWCAGPRK